MKSENIFKAKKPRERKNEENVISEYCSLLAQSNQYIFRWGSSPRGDLKKNEEIESHLPVDQR
jgi:hypothetical protein